MVIPVPVVVELVLSEFAVTFKVPLITMAKEVPAVALTLVSTVTVVPTVIVTVSVAAGTAPVFQVVASFQLPF